MYRQVDLISEHVNQKSLVFIGDGDGISLSLAYLQEHGDVEYAVKSIKVLDFDERIVDAINNFAKTHNLVHIINAEIYNVSESLPQEHIGKYDFYYTNPPYGAYNGGSSIIGFMQRGLEATHANGESCIVIGDDRRYEWTRSVLHNVQKYLLNRNCIVYDFHPEEHTYHLDDAPDLKSCNMFALKLDCDIKESSPLPKETLKDFYGRGQDLNIDYIKNSIK